MSSPLRNNTSDRGSECDAAGGAGESLALRVYTRAELREIDRASVNDFGVPLLVLIENAATQLARVCCELRPAPPRSALLLCSRGNNGADALALARQLHNLRWNLHILLTHPPETYRDVAAIHLHTARQMNIPISVATPNATPTEVSRLLESLAPRPLIIDGLLGTGLEQPIAADSTVAALVGAINAILATRHHPMILSIDLPSGLDADTGHPLGPASAPAVRADVTVSFVGLKRGFTFPHAHPYLGRVIVAPINAPREIEQRLGTPIHAATFAALVASAERVRREPEAEPRLE